jgi:uncharacterized protein (DUF169 family)
MAMAEMNVKEMADFIRDDVRLKTLPIAVKFLKSSGEFPEKTRQPSVALGKRVTVCQGVTMARNYGWTVGLTREDLICVPAMIAFGFSDSPDPVGSLTKLFCEISFSANEESARKETSSMHRLENKEYEAVVLSPLAKDLYAPDTIVMFGNPAQMMRFIQSYTYIVGERVVGSFGGKVECDEYLIAPFKTQAARVSIPGNGDRIFSGAQDDEMAFSIPGRFLKDLVRGLAESGKKVGAKYPAPPYMNYQPEFPKAHVNLGKEVGIS